MLRDGLYEQIINRAIEKELAQSNRKNETGPIDAEEASKVLSNYIAEIVEQKLERIKDSGKDLSEQISLVNRLISAITEEDTEREDTDVSISDRGEQLLALFDPTNSIWAIGEKAKVIRPETSISQSSLFTGAIHEPQMYSELKKEIASCNRIDMLVSFIKWSGLRLIINELKDFTEKGGDLRIITTSYMGATDIKAIEELYKLPNTQIKVSYDTNRTRLHAKAYVFYRETGFSTAYVGSSNLSNAALSSGLEWNIKLTHKDLPETIDKISATFDSYWNSTDFEYYDEGQKTRLARALKAEKYSDKRIPGMYTLEVRPFSYQQEILDKLEAERSVRGHFRNLIVAATGTGKTVISALDYKRFRKENPKRPCRLLFVAHREEILQQSIDTFRAVLKDANFGELFVGNYRPDSIEHLFVSIQTFNSREFVSNTTADFYDFIVVDEFHHAAAKSYQDLLQHYTPKILLGLTATPERMDGKSILQYFDHRIAAEIRLPEAIDRKLLCPFQYFGVTDTVNLDSLKWTVGGYDKSELSNIYTLSGSIAKKRANMILQSLFKYVTDIDDVKGLGFCVSIEHAEFMCRHFNENGIPSMYLTGKSPSEERRGAKDALVSGNIRFIFVVDIYNEGVDIPEVNTVMFLRPTESLTIFLQQLGRGLRLADGKECLTVLDFIGQANKKYNFEEKFSALLTSTKRNIPHEIKKGFISAPKGCYIQLEKKAAKYVLSNIQASYGRSSGLQTRIATFEEDTGIKLTLSSFLDYYHLDPRNIYKFSTFSHLRANVGIIEPFNEPIEETVNNKIEKVFGRISVMDSRRLIQFLLQILDHLEYLDLESFSDIERRMFQMFYITVWGKTIDDWNDNEVLDNLCALADSPVLLGELKDLLQYQFDHIDFIDQPVKLGFDCPLDVYCTYTRDQLLVALDYMKPSTVREGVKWLPEKNIDVFFITLNKTDKDYSPSTMYKDYSINEHLFHWQSQSTTSEKSPTGQRYINHKAKGSQVLLFVREFMQDRIMPGAREAYTFLGTANYLSHEGEKPMSITWKLDYPIPAKYLKKTNKLVVG